MYFSALITTLTHNKSGIPHVSSELGSQWAIIINGPILPIGTQGASPSATLPSFLSIFSASAVQLSLIISKGISPSLKAISSMDFPLAREATFFPESSPSELGEKRLLLNSLLLSVILTSASLSISSNSYIRFLFSYWLIAFIKLIISPIIRTVK